MATKDEAEEALLTAIEHVATSILQGSWNADGIQQAGDAAAKFATAHALLRSPGGVR